MVPPYVQPPYNLHAYLQPPDFSFRVTTWTKTALFLQTGLYDDIRPMKKLVMFLISACMLLKLCARCKNGLENALHQLFRTCSKSKGLEFSSESIKNNY